MSQEQNRLPTGVFAASLTPLTDDLNVDHPRMAAHCRWLLDNGCDGVAPLGTTGEANSFTVSERMEILGNLIDNGIPPERLLVGTGCCAFPDTVRLTKHALSKEVGGVLMLPPFYYKQVSDDGLYASFERVIHDVADSRLKIYLYHFPDMSKIPFSHTLIERLLADYPNTIVGMKDSSGDLSHMKSVCEAFGGFRLYAGSEVFLLDVLKAGGGGCISSSTNITSQMASEIYADSRTNEARAEVLQKRLAAVRDVLQTFPLIPALKAIVSERLNEPSWCNVRPPNTPLDRQRFAKLQDALKAVKFEWRSS